jgi:hypothetical protein
LEREAQRRKGTVLDVTWLVRKGTHLVSGVSIEAKAIVAQLCKVPWGRDSPVEVG